MFGNSDLAYLPAPRQDVHSEISPVGILLAGPHTLPSVSKEHGSCPLEVTVYDFSSLFKAQRVVPVGKREEQKRSASDTSVHTSVFGTPSPPLVII